MAGIQDSQQQESYADSEAAEPTVLAAMETMDTSTELALVAPQVEHETRL